MERTKNRQRGLATAIAAALLLLVAVGITACAVGAQASGPLAQVQDRLGQQPTGAKLEQANAAALQHVGQGQATDEEFGEVEDADEPGDVDVNDAEDADQATEVDAADEAGEVEDADEPGDVDVNDQEDTDDGGEDSGAAPAAVDSAEDAAEGPDQAITGTALERASAIALDYVGQGRVTGTEVDDEEGYYEIEVTLDNGRQVDVHLDQNFNVLGHKADASGADD